MSDHQHHHDHDHDHHDHGHTHVNAHGEEQSLTDRDRSHWDKMATHYMSDAFQKSRGDLINKILAFILENMSWIGVDFLDPASTFEKSANAQPDPAARRVRFLDYACGPGTLTIAFQGYVSESIGIDLSEKMVEQYNKRFSPDENNKKNEGNETQRTNAHAVVGNLLVSDSPAPTFSAPEFFDFDLVAVGLGFHHFEHLDHVMQRLTERVKPGGVFMIIDFLPHQKNDMGEDSKHVAHNGFTADKVKELFSSAGLVDVDLKAMHEAAQLRENVWRTPFLAQGRKPLSSS